MDQVDVKTLSCLCGNVGLLPAPHKDYLICPKCNTAQLRRLAEMRSTGESIDFNGLYSADYWGSHQTDIGLPKISDRARTDLPERCLYWLDYLQQYVLPPARILEIGSAHGAFVKMMVSAGFDAIGMEMNPQTIKDSNDWFGINAVMGPIEKTETDLGLFDVIVMFDVMEHLTDPVDTLSHIVKHIKPGGILMVQTPVHDQRSGPTWQHFNPPEHTFLYSLDFMRTLLNGAGLNHIEFHPAIFPWDMFLFASNAPLPHRSKTEAEDSLLKSPDGRMVLGMFDLRARAEKAENLLKLSPFLRLDLKLIGTYFLSYCKQGLLRLIGSPKADPKQDPKNYRAFTPSS